MKKINNVTIIVNETTGDIFYIPEWVNNHIQEEQIIRDILKNEGPVGNIKKHPWYRHIKNDKNN